MNKPVVGPNSIKRIAKSFKTAAASRGYDMRLTDCQGIVSEVVAGKSWRAAVAATENKSLAPTGTTLDRLRTEVLGFVDRAIVTLASGAISDTDTLNNSLNGRIGSLGFRSIEPLDAVRTYAQLFEDKYRLQTTLEWTSVEVGRNFWDLKDKNYAYHLTAIEDYLAHFLNFETYKVLGKFGWRLGETRQEEAAYLLAASKKCVAENNVTAEPLPVVPD